jgi:hypothetical protein
MLRWLSFFGAIALVVIGVVFYVYKGPPATYFTPPEPQVDKKLTARPGEKEAQAAPAPAPAASGLMSGEVAVTPLVVISGARLTALSTPQVPSLHDGQILFLGTEIKPGEARPANAFKQDMSYLVTEAGPGETGPQEGWVQVGNKWYRPLKKDEDAKPFKLRLHRAEKWFRPVDEGTEVKKDDLLAVIDPVTAVDELSIRVAKLDAAEADKVASEKIREFTQKHLDTVTKLFANGAATREEVQEAKASYDRYYQEVISKGEAVKVASKELRQAETMHRLHEIRSKINGQVKQLIKHEGEAVKNLDPVLEMQDHTTLRIRARVDLQDMANLPNPRDPKDTRVLQVEATRLVPPLPNGVLTGHFDAVTGVAVSKDNRRIVSVSEDRTARVWQTDLTQRKAHRELRHPAAVRAVACTPPAAEKNLFLTGAADGVARLYDLGVEDVPLVRQLTGGHREAINCVAFSPDGRWAVTGGDDRAVVLWDVEAGTGKPFPADKGHRHGVTSVAFLTVGPEKKLSVVSAGRDNALIVWQLSADGTPEKVDRFDRRGGDVTTLGVNPDGSQLLFDQGKDLGVVSSVTGALVGRITAPGGANWVKLALFSPDGKLVLASTGAGRMHLMRAPTAEHRGHELEQLVWTSSRDEQAQTNCGAFAPDGSFCVTGTQSRNVIVWPMPKADEVDRPLTARIINLDPEVTSGQVRVTADLDNRQTADPDHPQGRLLPGDVVTLVVYPEKK